MDNQRDPGAGHLFTLATDIAYRKTFGGESSFDVGLLDLSWYPSLGQSLEHPNRSRPRDCRSIDGAGNR